MIVYQLTKYTEDEDEDRCEFFGTLKEARDRKKEVQYLKLEKLVLTESLSPKKLILAALNRKAFVKSREEIK